MSHEYSWRRWHDEFASEDLDALRGAIPAAIEQGQQRSAAAHAAYGNFNGEQFVYGAGMSRAAYKGLRSRLAPLPSFHTETIAGTRRTLMFVGPHLIFPVRVGKRMPRNVERVRVGYLPERRREILATTSVHKYDPPSLFTDVEGLEQEDTPTLDEAREQLAVLGKESLIVPYYSSVPDGVGAIYWAPARLGGGNYLDFIEPERLVYARPPAVAATDVVVQARQETFADGTRPPTPAKLRPKPQRPNWS